MPPTAVTLKVQFDSVRPGGSTSLVILALMPWLMATLETVECGERGVLVSQISPATLICQMDEAQRGLLDKSVFAVWLDE